MISLCLTTHAARQKTHRKSNGTSLRITRSAAIHRVLSEPYTDWNPQKIYRVPVILMSFDDCDFSADNDLTFYDNMFNKSGFNLGYGPGCVADYFRDQSLGQFNVKFDVVGPIKVTTKQKSHDKDNLGTSQFREVIKLADEQFNYADYDWDDDGSAQSVIIIYAGYGGNEDVAAADGCIWPNTENLYFSLDDVRIGYYSASPELWTDNSSCGIGTICHEFCHVLGLPDLYPTSGDEFSVLDEWDLMDGGCYSDYGWCPPNLSIHEREYLGWQTPEDLTEAKTITDLPSYDSSGKAYRIVNDAYPDEYYLLENRQWEGWDFMLPNHGLLITHVDFNEDFWRSNTVNSIADHHRLEYFHADNLDYNYYQDWLGGNYPYGSDGRSLLLQYTSYPYVDAERMNHDALTDTSIPAATLFNKRVDGMTLMGKSIADIREESGLISFCFSETINGIVSLSADAYPVEYYDLQGRRITEPSSGLFIIRYSNGHTRKVISDE